jgi:nicotinamide-nucleotide amidase
VSGTGPIATASILAIGDEIVGGLTGDTNSGFLAQLLRAAGVEVVEFLTVPDDEPAILRALDRAAADSDLVVATGGLGPTADDLTASCVATLCDLPLELHEESLARIEERFRDRGLQMPPNNRKQALFPRGSEILPNPDGTAAGFICGISREGREAHVACLPGVPREMRRMAEESLLPWIASRSGVARIGSRVFSTVGLTESKLDELLAGVIEPGEARLSFRAAFPRMQARVTVAAESEERLEERLSQLERRVRDRLGDHLYAMADEGLEDAVGRLLRERGKSLAVAESCTGGLIGHRITEVPGSSDYFLLGVVAYSNAMKHRLLGVPRETLREHGAVSERVVASMAEGVRAAADASIGIATSGIAGPGGGTPSKPVGTVCIGLAWSGGELTRTYELGSRSRTWIKEMTAQLALDQLRRHLLAGRS